MVPDTDTTSASAPTRRPGDPDLALCRSRAVGAMPDMHHCTCGGRGGRGAADLRRISGHWGTRNSEPDVDDQSATQMARAILLYRVRVSHARAGEEHVASPAAPHHRQQTDNVGGGTRDPTGAEGRRRDAPTALPRRRGSVGARGLSKRDRGGAGEEKAEETEEEASRGGRRGRGGSRRSRRLAAPLAAPPPPPRHLKTLGGSRRRSRGRRGISRGTGRSRGRGSIQRRQRRPGGRGSSRGRRRG